MKIIDFEFGKQIVIFDRFYSLEEVKKVAGAREGTYAEELLERIYRNLLENTRDLRFEYAKYYAVEYNSFAKFLFWRYLVSKSEARVIEANLTDETYIGFSRWSLFSYDDESIKRILESTFAALGERIYENKD